MPNPDGSMTPAEKRVADDRLYSELHAGGTSFAVLSKQPRWKDLPPGLLRDAYENFGKPGGQQPYLDTDR